MQVRSRINNNQNLDSPKSSGFSALLTNRENIVKSGLGCKRLEPDRALKSQLNDSKGEGFPLPTASNNSMSDALGFNFSNVKIHVGDQAEQMNSSLNAKAFTYGSDIYFNKGMYNPDSTEGRHILNHELSHVVEQNSSGPAIQRMELDKASSPTLKKSDWYPENRKNNDQVWKNANLHNLKNGLKDEYTQIYQRRDFYLWFYNEIRSKGFEVKWPLAAYIVAGGAEKVASHDTIVGNERLEVLLRQGNQIIFDDVFPKLKSLHEGPVLRGQAAADWDKKTLAEEQNLIQPLYKGLSASDFTDMEQIAKGQWGAPAVKLGAMLTNEGRVSPGKYHKAGGVPFFPSEFSLLKPEHRFKYGMMLAEHFAIDGKGMDVGKQQKIPSVSSDYTSGKALSAVKNKDNIHRLTSMTTNTTRNLELMGRIIGQLNAKELRIFNEDPLYKKVIFQQARLNRTQFETVTRGLDKETTKKLQPFMCPNCHDEQRRDAARKSQPTYNFDPNLYQPLLTIPSTGPSQPSQELSQEQIDALIKWIKQAPAK